MASWTHSGTLVGAAIPVLGFAADGPNGLSPTPIGYPLETISVQLIVNVDSNDFVAAATTFTLYHDGIATASSLVFAAGVVGVQQGTFNVAYATGSTFDLGIGNPGGAAEVGRSISFGASIVFP